MILQEKNTFLFMYWKIRKTPYPPAHIPIPKTHTLENKPHATRTRMKSEGITSVRRMRNAVDGDSSLKTVRDRGSEKSRWFDR